MENTGHNLLNQRDMQQLCQLCKQACFSINYEKKQNAISQLHNHYSNGVLSPKLLFSIFNESKDMLDNESWQIICFTLMEILYGSVGLISKQNLQGFYQMIMVTMEIMYDRMNIYSRVYETSKQLSIKGPRIPSYLINSIKRTLSMVIKYLTKFSISLTQLLPFQTAISSIGSQLLNIQPSKRRQLYFYFEIYLTFIKQLFDKNTQIEIIDELKITQNFQSKVITQIIKLMPFLINTIDYQFEMQELETKLNQLLQNKDNRDDEENRLASSMQMELPLAIIDAILYFPYILEDVQIYVSKPTLANNLIQRKQKEDQVGGAFIEPSHRYPAEIAFLFCSKEFLTSLFNIPKKLLSFITKQLSQIFKPNQNVTRNINRNFAYLYYYRLIMQYLARIAATDIQSSTIKKLHQQQMKETDVKISQNFTTLILENVFNFMDTNISQMYQNMEKLELGSEGWNYLRELTLRLEQATVAVICKLIQNRQLSNAIKSKPFCLLTKKNLNQNQTLQKIGQTLLITTKRQILLTPNITVQSILTQPPITIQPSFTNYILRSLFNFWLLAVRQKQYLIISDRSYVDGIGEKINQWVFYVVCTIVQKFSEQDLHVFCENGDAGHYQIQELADELTFILRFVRQYMLTTTKKYQQNILTYFSGILSNLLKHQKQSNRLYNIIILTKYIIFQPNIPSIKPDTPLLLPTHKKQKQPPILVMNITQNIISEIHQYLNQTKTKYTGGGIQNQYYHDITLLLYLYGFCKYWMVNMRVMLDGYQRNMRNMGGDDEEEKEKDDGEFQEQIDNVGINNCVMVFCGHFQTLDFVFRNRYMAIVKQFVLNYNQSEEFDCIIELCTQGVKIFANLTQNIQKLLARYKQITKITNISKPNLNPNLLDLQQFTMGIIWLNILQTKNTYINSYLQYQQGNTMPRIEKKFSQLLDVYQKLVEVFVSIQFQRDFGCEDAGRKVYDMGYYVQYVIQALQFNEIVLENNLDPKSQLAIQFGVINLTAVYDCMAKSVSYSSKLPSQFLRRLQKHLPLSSLMSRYIIKPIEEGKFELNKQGYKKIHNLLKLNKAIINGILQDVGLSMNDMSGLISFIGQCLNFWVGLLGYIDLAYRNREANRYNILEKFYEVIVVMLEIFMGLMTRNSVNSVNNLNFSLLGRQIKGFDNFIQQILRLVLMLYSHQQHIENSSQEKLSLKLHPELKKIVDNCFRDISLNLVQFIFSFTGHKFGKSMIVEETKYLMPVFTEIFILKLKEFICQANQISVRKNHYEIGRQNFKQEDTDIYICLKIIKIVVSFIRRQLVYEHKSYLQGNINQFLFAIHQSNVELIQTNHGSSSLRIEVSLKVPLELALFFHLIKVGIKNVQQAKKLNPYSLLLIIAEVLTQLVPIFARYDQILSSHATIKSQYIRLKNSCMYLINKELGISQNLLATFSQAWDQTLMQLQLEDLYSIHEESKFKNWVKWFQSCYQLQKAINDLIEQIN